MHKSRYTAVSCSLALLVTSSAIAGTTANGNGTINLTFSGIGAGIKITHTQKGSGGVSYGSKSGTSYSWAGKWSYSGPNYAEHSTTNAGSTSATGTLTVTANTDIDYTIKNTSSSWEDYTINLGTSVTAGYSDPNSTSYNTADSEGYVAFSETFDSFYQNLEAVANSGIALTWYSNVDGFLTNGISGAPQPGSGSVSQPGGGSYTVELAPGVTDTVYTSTYSSADVKAGARPMSISAVPGPAALLPFGFGLLRLVRARRRQSESPAG